MKLRDYAATLEEKMSEFDLWITTTLGEIRDTTQFLVNLNALKRGFDYLDTITDHFDSYTSCTASNLSLGLRKLINDKSVDEATEILDCVFNVFLLATGKTDNNLKCQFPIHLQRAHNITTYPKKQRAKWVMKNLSRTLDMKDVANLVIQTKEQQDFQKLFLRSYVELILSDDGYIKQLWSLGGAYVVQKQVGNESYLLSSIVIFQSRGSITATQGHIPEAILRGYMDDWGLKAGADYNTQDVEIGELLGEIPADNPADDSDDNPDTPSTRKKVKKRKYDFIIPYMSREDGAKVFIQSQFYAGDSGSVSHKVVDQTDSARQVTLKKYPQAVFVEYLDGAGYYSSLNGDLRRMLSKSTTKNFFQIKTAPLKLRRELQGIDFITTLEIEHAILRSSGNLAEVIQILLDEGYSQGEISTAIELAIENSDIEIENGTDLAIKTERVPIVRRYCFLDLIANHGQPINNGIGYLIVAGYSHTWGLPQADLVRIALEKIPNLQNYWKTPVDPFDDIQWLINLGFVKTI